VVQDKSREALSARPKLTIAGPGEVATAVSSEKRGRRKNRDACRGPRGTRPFSTRPINESTEKNQRRPRAEEKGRSPSRRKKKNNKAGGVQRKNWPWPGSRRLEGGDLNGRRGIAS